MALLLPSTSYLHYHDHQHHPQPDQRFLFIRSTQFLRHHFHQIKTVNPRRSVILSEQARENNALSPPTSSEYHHRHVSLPRAVTHLCQTQQFNKAQTLIQEVLERSYRTASIDKAIEVLIQACAEHEHIEIGRKLDQLVSVHFPHDMVLATRLITMYCLCGSPDEAGFVFNRLEIKNLFVWNAMISTYTRNGFYPDAILTFCELMSATEVKPDNFTLPCVIKACGGAAEVGAGGAVHGLAIKFTLVHDVFVGNALIAMYLKFRYEEEAIEVFENLTHRNLVSWNTMIRGYSVKGSLKESLNLFVHMLEKGLAPDAATTVTLLPVCAAEGDVDSGMIIHSLAVKLGLVQELNVVNSLMDMYGKCGFSSDAETLFEKSKYKNAVSWNCLIANRSRNQSTANAALNVIRRMNNEGGSNLVDEVTILNILLACVGSSELMSLKELHGYSIRRRFNYHELVSNALVTAYAKCGLLNYADNIFDMFENSNKTINLWNAIISGYAHNGDPERALDLFLEMIFSGLSPDCYTLGQLLGVCAQLRRLDSGREIHCFVLRNGMEMNSFLGVSLLSFYFSCEKLHFARALFEGMNERTLVHWNTMISGYLQNESPKEAIILFHKMVSDGIRPYEVALTSLLSACSKVLALHLGKEAHCFALKANLMEDSILSSAIIDMYAKCGCIEQSWMVFGTLDKKELASFNAMIAGLGIHGHGKWAVELFQDLERSQLKPDHCTFVNLLIACSHAGLVEEGVKQLKRMETIYNIQPRLEHYSCVVDMLGRAGELQQAIELVDTMPFEPDVKVWSSLASSGGLHGELSIGREIAQKLIELEPNSADTYVLQSNLMAQSDKWVNVRIIRRRMKEMGLKKSAGCSWIDIGGEVHTFTSGEGLLGI